MFGKLAKGILHPRDASLRRHMGDEGQRLVDHICAPESVARSMMNMYREVIDEHATRPVSWGGCRPSLFRVFSRFEERMTGTLYREPGHASPSCTRSILMLLEIE
jgi:hypothetical protein